VKIVIGDEPKLPLFDVNEVFIREVTATECEHMIATGYAELMTNGALKLTLSRDFVPDCA
jgi:hypothetical protein